MTNQQDAQFKTTPDHQEPILAIGMVGIWILGRFLIKKYLTGTTFYIFLMKSVKTTGTKRSH